MGSSCPRCSGGGWIDAFDNGCKQGSFHAKVQCRLCNGQGKVERPKEWYQCRECKGLGGFGTFGACGEHSMHFRNLCADCAGRGWIQAVNSSPSAPPQAAVSGADPSQAFRGAQASGSSGYASTPSASAPPPSEVPRSSPDSASGGLQASEMDREPSSDSMRCVICMERERSVMMEPCSHVCMCNQCAETSRSSMSTCPICRGPVQNFRRIFMS